MANSYSVLLVLVLSIENPTTIRLRTQILGTCEFKLEFCSNWVCSFIQQILAECLTAPFEGLGSRTEKESEPSVLAAALQWEGAHSRQVRRIVTPGMVVIKETKEPVQCGE